MFTLAFSGLRAFALSRSWLVSTLVFLLSMVTFGLNVVSGLDLVISPSLIEYSQRTTLISASMGMNIPQIGCVDASGLSPELTRR